MISWRESVNYDPIGDCCRYNRNKEYWDRQLKKRPKPMPKPPARILDYEVGTVLFKQEDEDASQEK